ncbi:MAG TPA: STAS domain-containing protein [Azonexus sp.]
MVFSFFKKQPEKMPERPAAKPRAPEPVPVAPKVPEEAAESLSEPLPDLEFVSSKPFAGVPAAGAKPVAPAPVAAESDFDHDDFDDGDFTESSVMGIDVDQGGDQIQGEIEHVVVLFANGQEAAARSLLETLIRAYPGSEGRRFWLLLLDLLQCVGDKAAFDKLAVDFAEACETSPPTWRQAKPVTVGKSNGQRRLMLQGVLTAEAAQPVADLAGLVGQGQAVLVECGKLVGVDDEVAGQLAAVLSEARRSGVAVSLNEVDGFLARLNERLVAGEPGRAPSWALLLELLQRHGSQEQFEERAVDYAVTFELSPPSWETTPVPVLPVAHDEVPHDDACYLEGDLKNHRFDELIAVLEGSEQPVLDFSGVRRMDFFSAGQLVNRIAPFKAQGREILIRSPNHLVAELMAVVGLNKQARIIVPKS